MPWYIHLGVSKAEILDSAPCDLWCYDDAFEMTKKEEEVRDYYLGRYMYEAVMVGLANGFRSKGTPAHEWRDKPIQAEIREATGDMTEEEKERQINNLFANLELMQANFEASNSGR